MLSHNLAIVLLGVWIALGLSTLLIFALIKRQENAAAMNLLARTKSWWLMIALFSLSYLTNELVAYLLLACISLLALNEYLAIVPKRQADKRILFWAYLAIPLQFYWAYIGWYGMFLIFIPVYMFLFVPFRLLLSQETQGFLKSVGTIQWGLMLTVFTLSHMAFLLSLPNKEVAVTGAGLLLYLVLLTQFNDIAQYVVGKSVGKHKIMPIVSPMKTWEGFIGGMVLTTLLSSLVYQLLTPFSFSIAILSGLMISLSGFIGDVTISTVKRDLEIKDTSKLIPGHGGILDRVDSLTYAAPIFFHFVYYLYY